MDNMKKLIVKAKAGNKDAFAEIYATTKDKAYFVAARYVGTDDIADVLQDAYIAAMQNISSFDESKPFEPWLHTIIRNKALDLLKKKKSISIDDDTVIGVLEDTEAILPESYLENVAKRRDILAIVDKLPDAQRITVVLHYFEGQTTAEISELMGCSINTVSSRLRYARKAIREAVLMEEEKGNKLLSIAGTPFLAELFKLEAESGFYKMPTAMSAQVSSGIASGLAASSAVVGTVASTIGVGAKIMALSVGVKTVVAVGAAIVLAAGIGIPVYIHSENEKAVAAMAVIQQQEIEEQARLDAEAASIAAADAKAKQDAEVSRIAAEKEVARIEAARIEEERIRAEEEAKAAEEEAARLEEERIAAEEAAIAASQAQQAAQSSQPANKDETSYQSGSTVETQGGGKVTIVDPDDLEVGGGRTGWSANNDKIEGANGGGLIVGDGTWDGSGRSW